MGKVVRTPKSDRISFRVTCDVRLNIETEILPSMTKEKGIKYTMTDYLNDLLRMDFNKRNIEYK